MELWRKNLYILWGTQFLAMVGMNLVIPFLPFYIRELGVSDPADLALWNGLAFSGTFFSAFLATPFWGMLGDRYGRKAMVVRAIFGLGLSQVLIGLAQDPLQLVFFRVVQGGISGFIASALALVSTNTPGEKTGYAIGILQASTAAGTVLGPLIGGVLADLIGYREIFFVTAALCGIGGIVVTVGVREEVRAGTEGAGHGVLDNYRLMITDRRLRLVAVGLVVGQLAVLMVEPFFALFIESFGTAGEYTATLAGGIIAISGVFMIISAPWWGRRAKHRKSLVIAFALAGIAYAGHAVVGNLLQLGALRAVLGFFRGGILPILYSLTSAASPVERRGGMMAIASSLTLLGNMCGPTVGGFIAGRFSLQTAFLANALLLLALALLFWKRMDDDTGAAVQESRP